MSIATLQQQFEERGQQVERAALLKMFDQQIEGVYQRILSQYDRPPRALPDTTATHTHSLTRPPLPPSLPGTHLV